MRIKSTHFGIRWNDVCAMLMFMVELIKNYNNDDIIIKIMQMFKHCHSFTDPNWMQWILVGGIVGGIVVVLGLISVINLCLCMPGNTEGAGGM